VKTIQVAAACILSGPKVLIARRSYGDLAGRWEFPGGKVEPGETSAQALVREIREEMAVDITVDSFLMTREYDYPQFHLQMDCFLCTLRSGHMILNSHTGVRWIPLDDTENIAWVPADEAVYRKLQHSGTE
jgi:8-oxo-dGTP diphosphatase